MLDSLITSKTRLRLLVKFFVNITNQGYLNSLANEFGESTNSVRKELNNLSSAGYLKNIHKTTKLFIKLIHHILYLELSKDYSQAFRH